MSRARLACAFLGLALGFLFYLGYRTDRTVSNRLVIFLTGPAGYLQLKQAVRQALPVPRWCRGSLPSALWCFIVTSLCGGWKLRRRDRTVLIAWLAPLVNAGWEIVQWLGWTNGRGDWQDAVAGVVGWAIAQAVFLRADRAVVTIPTVWNWRMGVVMTGIASMGLAAVWK